MSLQVLACNLNTKKRVTYGIDRRVFFFLFYSFSQTELESACNAGDLGLIPGLERSPGEGNGTPLQYSCLENPMDRGAWQATVHGVTRVGHNLATKERERLSQIECFKQQLVFGIFQPPPFSFVTFLLSPCAQAPIYPVNTQYKQYTISFSNPRPSLLFSFLHS